MGAETPPGVDDDPKPSPQPQPETISRPNGHADFSIKAPPPEDGPDMSVLRLGRRAPPALPLDVFGPAWGTWILEAAEAAAAPPDYVAMPLLAAASALIGNARWPMAWPGWFEPPHLWTASMGDSGTNKSAGGDALQRHVLPELERRMTADFPEQMREWQATAEAHAAACETWKTEVRSAQKAGRAPALPPAASPPSEPQAPRLRLSDVTIEKVASLLATTAPKGLLITRDELAGWLLGLCTYNEAGRAFWLEAYGGRPYRLERVKSPEPVVIPRLAVSVSGTLQPEKAAGLFREADDGLLGRFIWAWPDAIPFRRSHKTASVEWATDCLEKLRALTMAPPNMERPEPHPILVPLTERAATLMEAFGQDMQRRQGDAGGLMRSAFGKARGLALRLSLVLALLRWSAEGGWREPPTEIDEGTFLAACALVSDYFMPMAERVYGDAGAPEEERNAATLARWIVKHRATEVAARALRREVRLPGLDTPERIEAAVEVLIDAMWLRRPPGDGKRGRPRLVYQVNPYVHLEASL